MKDLKILIFVILITWLGCKKDEQNHKPQADFIYIDRIDHFELKNKSIDEDGDVLTYTWVSSSNLINISDNTSSSTIFDLPVSDVLGKVQVKLIVSDSFSSDSTTKEIELPALSIQRSCGLGINLKSEKSNDVAWNWYLDQMNTGTFSFINCGPTSVTMSIKWFDQNFEGRPEDARNIYHSNGGWWYTTDIILYLNGFLVNNKSISLTDFNKLKTEIDDGNIAILCLDMYYIRQATNDKWHIDKFYSTNTTGWGHFIVVKGYKQVDNEIFYEVYDPYSYGIRYTDGAIKGKDRYYRKTDLQQAAAIWWNYAIIVSKHSLKNSKGIDIKKIKHMPGR